MSPNESLPDGDAPKRQRPSSPEAPDTPDELEPPFAPSWLEVEALRAMYLPTPRPASEDKEEEDKEEEDDDEAPDPQAPRPDP